MRVWKAPPCIRERLRFPIWRVDLAECRWYQKRLQPSGGFRNILKPHEFLRGLFVLPGPDHQTNFASPRTWRSLRIPIAACAFGLVALLAGCNDINPYLGAAAQFSSDISYITPSSRPAGCSGFTLDIHGSGFVDGAVVTWNNGARATDFESGSELLATITSADLATQSSVSIGVTTPVVPGQQNQGNNLSNFVPFTIGGPVGQGGTCPVPPTFAPTVTALSIPSGTPGTTLEIAGNYFGGLQNTSTITFNSGTNSTLATPTAWSGTLLTLTVPTGAAVGSNTIVVNVGGVQSVPQGVGVNVFDVVAVASGTTESSLKSSAASSNTIFSFASTANPRYATFVAPAADPSVAGTGPDRIYLRDTCQGAPAGCSPTTALVSVGIDGTDPDGASRSPSVSANGRFVAFASDADNLVPGDANGVADIFLRDTCIGVPAGCVPATTRISVGPDGAESNGASGSPSITSDGRFVTFNSAATNLVSDGQANAGGAFLWDSCFGVASASGCTPSLTRLPVSSIAPR